MLTNFFNAGCSYQRQWIYDAQLRPVAEMDSAGSLTVSYIYGTHINIPDYIVKGTTTYRVTTDHLGSLRFVINSSNGTIAQRIDYDDWGNVLLNTSPDFTPFGFAGGIYDKDTKLTRFGARDYDAEVGRWTSKDMATFGGRDTNLYSYCFSTPTDLIDPEGGLVIKPAIIEVTSYDRSYTTFQVRNAKFTCEEGKCGDTYKITFALWLIANVTTTPGARAHEMRHVSVGMDYFTGMIKDVFLPVEKRTFKDRTECEKVGNESLEELIKRINQFNFKYWWKQCRIELSNLDILTCLKNLF
jgi:RHS repeat-associated protein